MVPQHKARPKQSIGSRFQMTGDAVDKMKMARIDVRADKSHGDRALALICLVLDRDHVIDGLEELLHILTRAAAMHILRRSDGALERLRAVDEEIGELKKRRGQFQA